MRLKVHPGWICQTKRATAWEFEWCHYLCFCPLKNSSRPMTSLSRSQLDSPARLALCWGLFTYFYNGQIRRVQYSMKHFTPSDSCSGLSLQAHPILNSLSTRRVSVAGKQRTGAENSFISVLIPLSVRSLSSLCCQGWYCKPVWQLRFCLILWNAAVRVLAGPAHSDQALKMFI